MSGSVFTENLLLPEGKFLYTGTITLNCTVLYCLMNIIDSSCFPFLPGVLLLLFLRVFFSFFI